MLISPHIDGGVLENVNATDSDLTFDLRPRQKLLNVVLRDLPSPLTLHFLLDEKGAGFLVRQGILLSDDGQTWQACPLEKTGDQRWSITLTNRRELRVATRHPYGRDALDRLLCDHWGHAHIRPRMLRRDHRSVLLFECGHDDGRKPIHTIIAGEDVGETSGSIVADGMLRALAAGGPTAASLLKNSLLRIVTVASPFCAATPSSPSYTTLDGQGIYGAATWGDDTPPPEYGLLRDLVDETIAQRRLGLMLTIHSWQAQEDRSGMEFICSSRDNRLAPARQAAATSVLNQLMHEVPLGRTYVAEKIWHPGLARDYLMWRHNVVSYRVEITTVQGCDFPRTSRQFLENINAVKDWSFVLP